MNMKTIIFSGTGGFDAGVVVPGATTGKMKHRGHPFFLGLQ